jgi:hypothetical protein
VVCKGKYLNFSDFDSKNCKKRVIPFIKVNGALHHQYVCLGMVNMSFPRRRESRFPSGHYANGKLCRAQKFIMIGIKTVALQIRLLCYYGTEWLGCVANRFIRLWRINMGNVS